MNTTSGDTLWEPSSDGYIKLDGMLVLSSGQIIEDPLNKVVATRFDILGNPIEEDDSEEAMALAEKMKRKLCSECSDRIAIRYCSECGDKFCSKCYKFSHATGNRRRHNYSMIGPIDCTECELVLAERFCVPCDESFCDPCWRKLHSRGKRLFHPFCEVSVDGRIDSKIFTMDGQQVSDYNSTYSQERVEEEKSRLHGGESSIVAVNNNEVTEYNATGNCVMY